MRRVVLATVALLAGSVASARADLVYVLNSGESYVTVIDSTTRSEMRRIPVLREPHHLILTRDGKELMVADSAANEILWLNPDTGDVLRRERISNPYHLGYSPDGKYFVVNSLRRGQVDIYNADDMTLLARLPTPTQPSHMAFSPDSKRVFITLQGTRGLIAIDLDERRPVWTADVGPQPAGVIWHNDRLLVGVMGGDYVTVVKPNGEVERHITTARGSHTVWLSPDGKTIYANSRVDSAITLLDAETLEVKGRWDMPGGPDDIAFAPDGKIWVTLRWTARLAIVDPATGRYETIRVGRSPHGVFVHPTPSAQPVASVAAPAVVPAAAPVEAAPAATAEPPPPAPVPDRAAISLVGTAYAAAPTQEPAAALEDEMPPEVAAVEPAPMPRLRRRHEAAPWWVGLTWR